MEIAKNIKAVKNAIKQARQAGRSIALVPTMGAIHIGHISLIAQAAKQTDFVVVSIFVNPTQFGPSEDADKYPRPIDADLKMCRDHKADLVFIPTTEIMYPQKNLTWVEVEDLTSPLCGRSRPGHFRGVTTVCTKLFNILQPDVAFFGQKDAQQAIVIKKMVADLNMPLKIVVCPTIREDSGLAVSSRNQYLSEKEKADAANIYKSLLAGREIITAGSTKKTDVINEISKILAKSANINIEYLTIVDAETLQETENLTGSLLIAIAAKIGNTRLIDNIIVDCRT